MRVPPRPYPFDLHTHSDVSDGDFSPEHVFRRARALGLRGVVLTDHNTTRSMAVARTLARRFHLLTLDGLEISTRALGIELHFVAYAHRFRRDTLERELRRTQRGSTDKVRRQVTLARARGIADITFRDVRRIRPRAPFLVKYDLVRALAQKPGFTRQNAIALLNRGGALFVPYGAWALSPIAAIRLVGRAGGMVSFAHPGQARQTLQKHAGTRSADRVLTRLLADLSQRGLRGLEIRHPNHTPDDEAFLRSLLRRFRLTETGGSDYHGRFHHPKRLLGAHGLTFPAFRAWERLLR